jgi:hypothetical protein
MQIWRRVDSSTFVPDCVTGMPEFLGFTLIGTVPIGTTTFNDNNGGQWLGCRGKVLLSAGGGISRSRVGVKAWCRRRFVCHPFWPDLPTDNQRFG